VGLRLAIRRPSLLRTLSLLDTSADGEPPQAARRYRLMALAARIVGRAAGGRIMPILFGRTFLEDPRRAEERRQWRERLRRLDRRATVRATHGVLDRAPVLADLGKIATPTLIVVGDETWPPSVPGRADGGRHPGIAPGGDPWRRPLVPVEQPGAVTAALETVLGT